jgi:hypothetical protein
MGGKQVILKRTDHRFIKRIELVSHNGRTSFPQSRALGDYHECANRGKSFSKKHRREVPAAGQSALR